MGSDRKAGIIILICMTLVGIIVLAGIIFGVEYAGLAFLIIMVGLFLYVGLIATIYDEDPFNWAEKRIEKFLEKE